MSPPLNYPLPFSSTSSTTFLRPSSKYHSSFSKNFSLKSSIDYTEYALKVLSKNIKNNAGGEMGLKNVMGDDVSVKLENLLGGFLSGSIETHMMTYIKK
jgi:hypothetical protein